MRKSKSSFDNVGTANRLMAAMEIAIENMIQEIQKPVDQELSGSQRKAELQAIKQTAIDAKELIVEREKLQLLVKQLHEDGEISEEKDYSGGFAEQHARG
jgi:hypothetical protein